MKYDIHKAGGIIIKNKKILVTKPKGKNYFIAPGGKLNESENSKETLLRELQEELGILVKQGDLEEFGTFYAIAKGQEKKVKMNVFMVKSFQGQIEPQNEIEKIEWIDSNIPKDMELGSIFEHEVIPRLKKRNLID